MKTAYLLLIFFLLTGLILSCGTKESIQRDINIETDSISFTFPVITDSITNPQNFATISTGVSLDEIIKTQTDHQFDLSTLKSARVIGFKIKLTTPDTSKTNYNNLRVFSTLSLGLKPEKGETINIGSLNNNPDLYSTRLSIPITNKSDLVTYLSSNISYIVTGAVIRKNTKEMKAKAVIQYQLNVGR